MRTIYICENCDKEYTNAALCRHHERNCKKFHCHKCANYYEVLGKGNCKIHDQGKKCYFKGKKKEV